LFTSLRTNYYTAMSAPNGTNGHSASSLTNYCAFVDPARGIERIGHLDESSQTVQPLAFKSGTYLSNLYQVIQVGEDGIIPSGEPVPRTSIQLLPPINGRDILCVGKNYSEHAKEFNKSGFDSSDKVDQPTHPVIFSKRFTSIIADGEDIYPHPKFTETVDYEGELGVIVGKKGFRIGQDEAMDYIWGYTIINDMTARERQRDHKQFYIGKSPDTFCPMVRRPGPAISTSGYSLLTDMIYLIRVRSPSLLTNWAKCFESRLTSTENFARMLQLKILFSAFLISS
jgi:hypothetical protein